MLTTYSIWRAEDCTLHLSEGHGFPRDHDGMHIVGVTSKQYLFVSSSLEEAQIVLSKAIAVWGQGEVAPDTVFRRDLEEARIRDMDYSSYLPFKNKEVRDVVKRAYARAIADGTLMGFTDEDWEDANNLADTLLRSRE